MARKVTRNTYTEGRKFVSSSEIEREIGKLRKRIEEFEELVKAPPIDSDQVESVRVHMVNNLRDIYGQGSAEFDRYEHWRILPMYIGSGWEDPAAEAANEQRNLKAGIEETVKALTGVIRQLEEKREDIAVAEKVVSPAPFLQQPTVKSTKSKRVFVVHGKNDQLKIAVARLVENLGLEAVILHEQPDGGKTVIEKLEANSIDIGYAIVLLTPDDEGYLKGHPEEAKPRARQNVLIELGLFIGLIGRENVCCLNGGVDLPSDYDGVVYVPVDSGDSWKYVLAKNMKHAGYPFIDLNKVK